MQGKASDRIAREKTLVAQKSKLKKSRIRRSSENTGTRYFLRFNGKLIYLDKRKKYTIGRAQNCEIQIKDPKISRQHCRLKWNADSHIFIFEDLASRNGSLINEKPVNWIVLKNGDMINLVGNILSFEEQSNRTVEGDLIPDSNLKANMLLEQKFSHIMRYVDDRHLKDRLQEYHELIAASRQELSLLAYHDQTTGLFNRRYFNISIEREVKLANRKQQPLSLVMIDIDHFKKFNDMHGHQKGDEVLEGVAGFIRSAIRSTDIACRYGGEEMTVILSDTSIEKAFKVAEKIRKKVALLSQDQFGLKVSISLGVAATTSRRKTCSQLIQAADSALYQAKNNGRNCTVIGS